MIINLAGDKPIQFYETENPLGWWLPLAGEQRSSTRRDYAQLNRNIRRMKKAYKRLKQRLAVRVDLVHDNDKANQ